MEDEYLRSPLSGVSIKRESTVGRKLVVKSICVKKGGFQNLIFEIGLWLMSPCAYTPLLCQSRSLWGSTSLKSFQSDDQKGVQCPTLQIRLLDCVALC